MESLHFQGCSDYVEVQVDSVYPDPPGPFMVPVCEVGEVVSLPIPVGVLGVKPAVLKYVNLHLSRSCCTHAALSALCLEAFRRRPVEDLSKVSVELKSPARMTLAPCFWRSMASTALTVAMVSGSSLGKYAVITHSVSFSHFTCTSDTDCIT